MSDSKVLQSFGLIAMLDQRRRAQREGKKILQVKYTICRHNILFKHTHVLTLLFLFINIVARLMDMGFPKDKCITALNNSGGDENTAVAMLCSEL